MRSVIGGIAEYLMQSQELLDALEGGAIYDVQQPSDDEALPVLLLSWQENPHIGASKGVRLGLLICDIWDHQGSSVRVEKIRDEIEYLLDRRVITVGDKQWIRLFIGGEQQVPTEVNEPLVHWTIDFDVRYWRQAWVERLLSG